jgi:hypothetical protein
MLTATLVKCLLIIIICRVIFGKSWKRLTAFIYSLTICLASQVERSGISVLAVVSRSPRNDDQDQKLRPRKVLPFNDRQLFRLDTGERKDAIKSCRRLRALGWRRVQLKDEIDWQLCRISSCNLLVLFVGEIVVRNF